jgi:hypothetical protein
MAETVSFPFFFPCDKISGAWRQAQDYRAGGEYASAKSFFRFARHEIYAAQTLPVLFCVLSGQSSRSSIRLFTF